MARTYFSIYFTLDEADILTVAKLRKTGCVDINDIQ